MCNSRSNPTHSVFDQQFFNQHCRRESLKIPRHPLMVQDMNCFTAKACGRWLPLHSITLQGYTPFRHLPLPSVHCQPPASAPTQECFHSFHFAHVYSLFHSVPLWLYSPHSDTQSQNGKLHSTQPNSLLSIQSPPLLFPMPTSGMSCGIDCPI